MGSLQLRLLYLFLLLFPVLIFSAAEEKELDEEFSEELLLRPLPDRKVLAHFHFESKVPPTRTYGSHHHLFPKSIYQLVHKFRLIEMELSFTQGRWNYGRWGGHDPISSNSAKPPGVELWASFDVPQDQVDASWKNLTHALSGLFCASINFLEHSTAYSAPEWSFRSFAGNLRYGTLPREAVCTENLTPWLKLLPCRDKSGLSALMDRPSIYKGFYHSQRLHLVTDEFGSASSISGTVLEQTLTVVLQPTNSGTAMVFQSGSVRKPTWSLSSLFGRKVPGRCVLSRFANVYVQLDQNLVTELNNKMWKKSEGLEGSWSNQYFEMSIPPLREMLEVDSFREDGRSILYQYVVENYTDSDSFDVGFKWKMPITWSCKQAPLQASRFLMGSGNERGSIAVFLKSTGKGENILHSRSSENGCWLRVNIFQIVPWYVKAYYHTLKVFLDGELQYGAEIVEKLHVSPSEDKVSPGVMEIMLRLPCNVTSAALTVDFDKGFLHIDEYPPDANQGFDIPSAVVHFADFQTSNSFQIENALDRLPILSKLQKGNPILLYTEVLLVPLTTPDFSMPYNVITITCTVFALYFGSLLNVLRRRVGEEERLLKSKAKKGPLSLLLAKLSAKLRGKEWKPPNESSSGSSVIGLKMIMKVLLIAGIAVCWQLYFS